MKAELHIDTAELEEKVVQRVVKALKPLLKGRVEEDKFFTVKTLSAYLEVSEKWIYERVQFKELPYYKIGGNLRFKKSVINRWLEENCKTPARNPISINMKVVK